MSALAFVLVGSLRSSVPPFALSLPADDAPALDLPAPVAPAFTPSEPRLLRASETISRYAVVRREVFARERPELAAPVIGRVATRTPENTTNIVLVLGRVEDDAGRLWIHVRLPLLTTATGWVPRDALGGYGVVRTQLVVDVERLTATLFRDGRSIFKARIGVGKRFWPTPKGKFYIRNKLRGFNDPFYGPLAFGTSARSRVLTDWPAGGFIGIHGTNAPELLPGRVSHGCIRLRNSDILELGRLMPVGTPVTVR